MRPWMAWGAAVLGLGLLAGGQGFLNGDAAVYTAQAWDADLWERPTHVGWVAVGIALSGLGPLLPRALDGVVALCAAAIVARAVQDAPARERTNAGLVAAGFVLPWCGFAEVDLPWIALVLWAARVAPAAGSACLLAAAVCISPVALLASPWVAVERRHGGVLIGAMAAVVALTVMAPDWWWGHRGVLHGAFLPGRTLQAWATSGVLVVAVTGDRRLLALLPLLLAPPDVPGWVLVGAAAAGRWPSAPWARGLALLGLVAGSWGLQERWSRVAREDQLLQAVSDHIVPGQAVEAPWSWGARLSVLHTGTAYGLPWVAMPPVRGLPDGVDAVGLLPPGRTRPGEEVLRVDANGVTWVRPWWRPSR